MATDTRTPVTNDNATRQTPTPEELAKVSGTTDFSDAQLQQIKDALGSQGQDNLRKVFAYQMRDTATILGAVKAEKMQGSWLVNYICSKLKQDEKSIRERIENKRILLEAKSKR